MMKNYLNKTQALLLAELVCNGDDYINFTAERRAATQLEKMGYLKVIRKKEMNIWSHEVEELWKGHATRKGQDRILGKRRREQNEKK